MYIIVMRSNTDRLMLGTDSNNITDTIPPEKLDSASPARPSPELTAPAPPGSPGTVPLCAHESLTSARLALILTLPNIKPAGYCEASKELDALTAAPPSHHRQSDKSSYVHEQINIKISCQPLGPAYINETRKPRDATLAVQGTGEYSWRYAAPGKNDVPAYRSGNQKPYFALTMKWEVCMSTRNEPGLTIETFGEEIAKAGVVFCAHKRLSDFEFLEVLFETVNPNVELRDPIMRF